MAQEWFYIVPKEEMVEKGGKGSGWFAPPRGTHGKGSQGRKGNVNAGKKKLKEWEKLDIHPKIVGQDKKYGPIIELYHGSPEAQNIEDEGFDPAGESQYSIGGEPGVFFSEKWGYAAQHGTVVTIHIPAKAVELYQENPLDPEDYGYIEGNEFIVYWEDLGLGKIKGWPPGTFRSALS